MTRDVTADVTGAAADGRRRLGPTTIPLTLIGLMTLSLGAVAYAAGWRLGWIELMVVAGGCLVAFAFAVPFVIGRIALDVDRSVEPPRVMVGERAVAELTVSNPGRRRTRAVNLDERISAHGIVGAPIPVPVPSLGGSRAHSAVYPLPTARRARVTVGPAEIVRADPLGMLRRSVAQAPATTLWVHPRWTAVAPLPSGYAKDLEGPTSDTSPAGDIAFHALRPYQLGDDRRHIHWMSTARSGTLMVRHYVDNRRPTLGVLLDTDATVHGPAQFETAVEIVTSLVMSSLALRLPVTARSSTGWILGRLRPGSPDSILETMTEMAVDADQPSLAAAAVDLVKVEPTTSAVAIVTGGRSSADLLRTIGHLRGRARVIVITVSGTTGDGSIVSGGIGNGSVGNGQEMGGVEPPEPWSALPGARVMRVGDLDEFRIGWGGLAS